ncbi:MAG: hydroxyacid dehydrogenase [Schleiferiaceae bacterium]|nr:hydroxyacid dehydrogenase [Schleiferiaceae bacterium]
MTKGTVIHLDVNHPSLLTGLEALGYTNVAAYTTTKDEVMALLPNAVGLVVRSRFPIDASFLQCGTALRWIARVGAGMENIDLEAATQLGITCVSAPEGNRDAVGEHAVGMLLALRNNLLRADQQVRNGTWDREGNRGWEIQGKTVGIIGYGHMGSAFAEKLQGFGVSCIAYDKYKTLSAHAFAKQVPLQVLFEETDILSLHLPQTPETKQLVDAEFLQCFRKPIIVINTARGNIVNTQALLEALHAGRVIGACLDVLEFEKSSFEHLFDDQKLPPVFEQLLQDQRVILSPHIAGWSVESAQKMAAVLLDKIAML